MCKNGIEKRDGCNWITCKCGHGFCWLCFGDAAAHPGRAGNHALQCNNEAEVKQKGREAFMLQEGINVAELGSRLAIEKKI